MAISRFRNAFATEAKFPYRLNSRTNKPLNLTFFESLKFNTISPEALADLQYVEIAFNAGNTLAMLSSKFYGTPSYWWLIALVNNVSCDQEIAMGQALVILFPPELVISEFGL